MTVRVFPVALSARPAFSNDWGQPRSGGRSHEGTDIFAPRGSPVLAVTDGTTVADTKPLGGLVVFLRASDGSSYYYAHLDSYAGDFPREVRAGETLGYVGNTGNAVSTAPHLHFGIYRNGAAVNPYPELMAASGAALSPSPPLPSSGARSVPAAGGGLGLLFLLWLWSRRA